IGTIRHEAGDAVGERRRLARAGAGDDEERARGRAFRRTMLDRAPLPVVEPSRCGARHALTIPGESLGDQLSRFAFVRRPRLCASDRWQVSPLRSGAGATIEVGRGTRINATDSTLPDSPEAEPAMITVRLEALPPYDENGNPEHWVVINSRNEETRR